jgi:hypothetical protein
VSNFNPFGDMLVTTIIVTVRIKTYAKENTQIIAHGNMASSRREMTKLILFRGT